MTKSQREALGDVKAEMLAKLGESIFIEDVEVQVFETKHKSRRRALSTKNQARKSEEIIIVESGQTGPSRRAGFPTKSSRFLSAKRAIVGNETFILVGEATTRDLVTKLWMDVAAKTAERSSPSPAIVILVSNLLEELRGRDLAELDESALREAARVMADLVPTTLEDHPYREQIGPVYTTAGVQLLLNGITKQAVDDRVKRGLLMRASTSERRNVFPVWQFDGKHVRSWVAPVAAAFINTGMKIDWPVLSWLTTPVETLGGRTPVEWLDSGEDLDPVLHAAQDVAFRWTAA